MDETQFTEEQQYFIDEYKDVLSIEEILEMISLFDDPNMEVD